MVCVTANARLARELRREHDLARRREGQRLWEAPDILPWDAWLRRCWREEVLRDGAGGQTLLTAWQERCLWEQVIEGSREGRELIHPRAAARTAAEAWRIAQEWDIPLDAAQFAGYDDAEAFLAWAGAFRRRMREGRWLTEAELPAYLGARLPGGGMRPADEIRLAGFDDFTLQQERWLQALTDAGWKVEHIDAPAAAEPVEAWRCAFGDAGDEMRAAAAWARERLEHDREARIGVVVPNLEPVRAALERIFAETFHPEAGFARTERPAFHISLGPPLAAVPVTAAALAVLGLARPSTPVGEYAAALRSPYWEGGDARRDAELRRSGMWEVSETPAALAGLPRRERPSGWSRAFAEALRRAGWPDRRALDSAEHQAVARWNRLLSELAELDAVLPSADFETAYGRLRAMAAEARFAPEDEGAPVQILGALEASGAHFDHLWIMDLEDGSWPPPPSPNPFLPLPLQQAHGAPRCSAARELERARRITARLLASAREAACSYPRRSGDALLRPSPLIAHLPERVAAAPRPEPFAPAAMEQVDDRRGPPLSPGALLRGGARIFERQAACPFSAFAEHRLHARPLEEVEAGLSPRERGLVVHRALELIWSELKSQAELNARTEAELAALVRRAAAEAVEDCVRGRGAERLTRVQELERRRLEALLPQWLEVEKQRAPFEALEREAPREDEVGGVRVTLRVDRVDRLESGGVAIVDYKTSAHNPAEWEGERPDQPQLPLYAVTDARPVEAVLFAQVVSGDMRFRGVEGEIDRAGWRATLERLGEEFARGEAAAAPKRPAQACRFCALNALCRITDQPRLVREDAS